MERGVEVRRRSRQSTNWLRRSLGGLLTAAALFGISSEGRAATASEYELKAVFLFNFAQFVDWPASVFPDSTTPFCIGILGDDPFGAALDEVAAGESIRQHPMVIRRFRSVEEVRDCHLLFVSRSELGQQDAVLARLRGRPILTVSDNDAFAQRGGMIRFVNERNRIRLRINLAAAQAAGLSISSMLLRPATIVNQPDDDP